VIGHSKTARAVCVIAQQLFFLHLVSLRFNSGKEKLEARSQNTNI
jgi:hypothetical protein